MTHIFRPHGEFSAYTEGQLLISEVTGPWNRELVQSWSRYVYPLAKQLSVNGPYVSVGLIHESMLCPSDALEEIKRVIRYASEKLTCIGNVIVADATVEGRDLVEPAFDRIYADVCPHRFYYDFAEAKAWAHELLRAETLKSGKNA